MCVPHLLLARTPRQLNGEPARDEAAERALDVGESRERRQPSRPSLDLAWRLCTFACGSDRVTEPLRALLLE